VTPVARFSGARTQARSVADYAAAERRWFMTCQKVATASGLPSK